MTIRGSRLDVGSELRVLVNTSKQCTDLRWDQGWGWRRTSDRSQSVRKGDPVPQEELGFGQGTTSRCC